MEIFQPVGIMHLILFMFYFALAVAVIASGKPDTERFVLALLMFCMGMWALCKVVMHNTLTPLPAAQFALDFGMFFNLAIPVFLLYFGLITFFPSKTLVKPMIPLILIALSTLVSVISLRHHLYLLEKGPYGWMSMTNPEMETLYNIFYLGPMMLFFFIMIANSFSKNPLKRAMGIMLAVAIFAAMSFYFFLPQSFLVANSADLEALPIMAAFFFAINKYGLFDLTESQAVKNIFNTMNELLFMTDLKGSITQANGVFGRVFGNAGDVSFLFGTREEGAAILEKAVLKGSCNVFTEINTPSKRMHVSVSVNVLKRLNYPVAAVWIISDMTAKKELEEHMQAYGEKLEYEVALRTAQVKESEEKFRTISEQSLLGTVIIQDNFIKYANMGFARITEYSLEEMFSWGPGEFIRIIAPEYRQMVGGQMLKKLNDEPGALESYRIKATTKSGRTGWVEVYGKKVMYSGRPSNMVSVIEVTKQQEAEDNLERSVKELKELSMLKQNFIAMVSHEMRTPLITIGGFTDILSAGLSGEMNEKQKEYLSIIKSSVERQAALVSDLLDLSNIEFGIFSIEKKRGLPQQAVDKAVENLQGELTARRISVVKEYGKNIKEMDFDFYRITQVVNVCVKNAIRHSPESSVITLGVAYGKAGSLSGYDIFSHKIKADEEACLFYVKDNGRGINQEYLGRVFEQFYQSGSEKSMVDKGAGLGLNLSKYIVEQHGGAMWAESGGIGKGAKFLFAIPVA